MEDSLKSNYGIDGKPIRSDVLGFENKKQTLPFKFMIILIIVLFVVNFRLRSGMISYLNQSILWILIISYFVYSRKKKRNREFNELNSESKYNSSYNENLIEEFK